MAAEAAKRESSQSFHLLHDALHKASDFVRDRRLRREQTRVRVADTARVVLAFHHSLVRKLCSLCSRTNVYTEQLVSSMLYVLSTRYAMHTLQLPAQARSTRTQLTPEVFASSTFLLRVSVLVASRETNAIAENRYRIWLLKNFKIYQ